MSAKDQAVPPKTKLAVESLRRTLGAAREVSLQFLLTDIELARSLLKRVLSSQDRELISQKIEQVANAYETIEGFLHELDATPEQKIYVKAQLALLASDLRRAERHAWTTRIGRRNHH